MRRWIFGFMDSLVGKLCLFVGAGASGAHQSNSGSPRNCSGNSLCARNRPVGQPLPQCAILYTIVENCRRLGIVPRDYLEDVLTRLPGMKANEVAALTPAAWLKARGGKAKRRAA